MQEYYRDTWAEIDLDAITHNVKQIKDLHPTKEIFAVVKANGYGHGDAEVSKVAIEAGVSCLAVSGLDEALRLRNSGIEVPILVLGMTRLKDVPLAAENNISLTAHDEMWIEHLVSLPLTTPIKVHLKIDSGMHRLGLMTEEQVQKNFNRLKTAPMVEVEGIFTHMATADSDKEYLGHQIETFKRLIANLDLSDVKYVHLENTATLLQKEFDFDHGIRLGLGLYGINPDKEFIPIEFELKPALKLLSNLVQVKKIKKGDKVGYGATYEAQEDEWIGVVPIGYADGWTRSHQGRHVIVNGYECEIIGRVCMDQMMIRLPKQFPMGTEVTLIGDGMPVERVAAEVGTISYEILCLISDRVPRVYKQGGKTIAVKKMRFE
ncbi:alanine racemase [Turicibacter bilis]|uniref:alanine racemase n=1 Tax=Turicibacter bilis TaxID=2735723 RepID=UPI001BAE86A7|nr:alanine racemase [Turicibacter bilis]MBS3203811.1 alanine racemase [Turicibacter bilis]MDY4814519.1 alanine racemase [Turicibacter bilis]UUF11315.1 alanine racemase [Turicibacter bilis]